MMVKPSVTELLETVDNRYTLAVMTAKRARQIATGDKPMTKVKEESPVTLAVNEIAEGKVTKVEQEESVEETDEDNNDEDNSNEG